MKIKAVDNNEILQEIQALTSDNKEKVVAFFSGRGYKCSNQTPSPSQLLVEQLWSALLKERCTLQLAQTVIYFEVTKIIKINSHIPRTLLQRREIDLIAAKNFRFRESPEKLVSKLNFLLAVTRKEIILSKKVYGDLHEFEDYGTPQEDADFAYFYTTIFMLRQIERIQAFQMLICEPSEQLAWEEKRLAYASAIISQWSVFNEIYENVRVNRCEYDPLGEWDAESDRHSISLPSYDVVKQDD